MRVLLDCRMTTWTGVGRYTTGLARALAARDDIELVQVCSSDETPPVSPGPNAGSRRAAAHPFGLRGALELGSLVRAVAPDVVHCAHFPTPMPVRTPLVVTLHDLIPLVVDGVLPSASKRVVYRWWNSRAARRADRIIVPSQATAEDVTRLFADSRHKVAVIPEAVDDFSSGPIGPAPGAAAESVGRPYLLSMGNTKPHKDLPTLLRAFCRLARSDPDLHLILVGTQPPGYLRAVLEGTPDEIQARVLFTGPVDDNGLRALYAGALTFVFPSVHEGFGLPPLEAMALGTPVVCSNASSLPEVVGDAALLFAGGDVEGLVTALESVIRDQAVRQGLSQAAREYVAHFTWEHSAAMTVAVYGDAVQAFAARARKRGAGR